MAEVLEPHPTDISTPRQLSTFQAAEIARDLALMDELEAFAQSLLPRTEGRSPTTQEIRVLAYEDVEAALL